MAKENIEYALCDFCHKAKPAKELENIKVTYRKCKDCKISNLEGSTSEPEVDKSAGVVVTEKKKRPGEGHPPAFLREAFRPPDQVIPKAEGGLQPKKETDTGTPLSPNATVEVKKEDDGANKSTTVQSPESGKSS